MEPLPDSMGFAGAFAGASGGALVVAGGANFPKGMPWQGGVKVWHDRAWVLAEPGSQWREAGRLARPLAYGVCVSGEGAMVCAGGSDAAGHHADVFRLKWNGSALEQEPLAPLPLPLAMAAGALVGGTFYVACGSEKPGEQSALGRVFTLRLADARSAWREIEPLPGVPRILPVAAVWEGEFLVFGGAALEPGPDGKMERRYLRDAWAYRADRGWKRLADLPSPAAAAPSPAPLMDGALWILGGDDGSRVGFTPMEKHPGFAGRMLAYEPQGDRWRDEGVAPVVRATVGCVEWRGGFVLPSGEVRPGVRSAEVWRIR